MKLQSQNITLRAVEPSDVDNIYVWENDTDNWIVSNSSSPFSKFAIEQYVMSAAQQDIYAAKQLRLIIEAKQEDASSKVVGAIDLFDFDPQNLRAGIGILIAEKSDRRKGYAAEALKLLIEYCFLHLNLHQLYCNITTDNEPSILLFQKFGFQITGIKKQWIRSANKYKDELLLQLIR